MWSDALKGREVAGMHDAANPTVDLEGDRQMCTVDAVMTGEEREAQLHIQNKRNTSSPVETVSDENGWPCDRIQGKEGVRYGRKLKERDAERVGTLSRMVTL